MSDDPKDVIEFAIRSAFDSYPKEDDPNWKPGLDQAEGMRAPGFGRNRRIISTAGLTRSKARYRPSACK
jgi:hypothetical protein